MDNYKWEERTFITFIEGGIYPVVCVDISSEPLFKYENRFMSCNWTYWKPIPEKKALKVTMQEIAEKYGVDEVQIVEKK